MEGEEIHQISQAFLIEGLTREFRQGEIISNLKQPVYDFSTTNLDRQMVDFAVILSQDCDLLQHYNLTEESKPSDFRDILLAPARPPTEFHFAGGGKHRKKAKENQIERYHFLESCPQEFDLKKVGLPELMIDFKTIFSLRPEQILFQCQVADWTAERRTRLADLYREHLQNRFASYMSRVALPTPHIT